MKSHRFTPVEISAPSQLIDVGDALITMGSCFADHIGGKLQRAKIPALTNPLGILYNPLSLAKGIQQLQHPPVVGPAQCASRGDIHFHYDYHSKWSGTSPASVATDITTAIGSAANHLQQSDWLLFTLGTSFAYELRSTGAVVANCHKMPAHLFDKRQLTVDESFGALSAALPTNKNIVVTVSPVRHTKEGLVHNQRSKARLIEIAHLLTEQHQHCSYFPAYEIVVDELRDYRYYLADMIHPSAEAVDIVWSRFVEVYATPTMQQQISAVHRLQQSLDHRPLIQGSTAHRDFLDGLLDKIQMLSTQYPLVDFSVERATVEARIRALA